VSISEHTNSPVQTVRGAAASDADVGVLEYYARQSPITNLGPFQRLFDELPRDISGIARVVQGLLMHPAAATLYGEPPESDHLAWGYRTMAETIEHILAINDSPLSVPRPPGQRLRGNCRNFAVLFVSILRHHGVPARRRVGFARYLPGPHWYTHEVAEYWSQPRGATGRWVLVDPQIDEPTLAAQRAFFCSIDRPERAFYDPLDLEVGTQFVIGGEAWRLCREGSANPDEFRSGPWMGLAEVACAALQDLDGLNKVELLSTDSGHNPSEELTPEDATLLDRLAKLAGDPDTHFTALRELFDTSAYGRSARAVLRRHGLLNLRTPAGRTPFAQRPPCSVRHW
jgi:hypothetical protein